jgi:hypothetical protein
MNQDFDVNLGDSVYYYCESSPYSIFCGEVIEVEKTESLKRKKRVVSVKSVTVKDGKYTWNTRTFFRTEREAALHCLLKAQEERRGIRIQLQCREDSIRAMREILKKYEAGK